MVCVVVDVVVVVDLPPPPPPPPTPDLGAPDPGQEEGREGVLVGGRRDFLRGGGGFGGVCRCKSGIGGWRR